MSGARSRRRLGLTPHPGAVARGPRTRPGERLLEVGPGTGFYTLPVAQWLGSDGQLGICDLQQEMLDHALRTARRRGLSNVTATQSDARNLPYADARFDGAYLITVLGEIPDQRTALGELSRVLRPGGRLVVGLFGEPHFVSAPALQRQAEQAGLRLEWRSGPPFGYFARLTPA